MKRVEEKTNIQLFQGAGDVTLKESLQTFLTDELGGKAPRTREWYASMILPFVEEIGEERPLIQVLEADLKTFYQAMEAKRIRYSGSLRPTAVGELSAYSLHGFVRAVRRWCRWMLREGLTPVDLSAHLQMPRLPKATRWGIADKDADAILSICREHPRDYAVFRFVEATGCRLGGVVHLMLWDLSLEAEGHLRRRAVVREKGEKERVVFLTDEALEALCAWLAVRPELPGEEHVFLGQHLGRPWSALTEHGVYEIFRRRSKQAGVKRNWSPHQWRHRLARKLIEQGMPLSAVAQILGHESEAITARFYGSLAVGTLQEMYDRYRGKKAG